MGLSPIVTDPEDLRIRKRRRNRAWYFTAQPGSERSGGRPTDVLIGSMNSSRPEIVLHSRRRVLDAVTLDLLKRCRAIGYRVTLIFLWLPSSELALTRVARRVSRGGHHIPRDVVIRRYSAGIRNMRDLYLPLADFAFVYDNSDERMVSSLPKARKHLPFVVHDHRSLEADWGNDLMTSMTTDEMADWIVRSLKDNSAEDSRKEQRLAERQETSNWIWLPDILYGHRGGRIIVGRHCRIQR